MKPGRMALLMMLALAGGAAQARPLMQPAVPAEHAPIIAIGCAGTGDQQLDGSQRQVRRQGNCEPNAVSSSRREHRQKREILVRRLADCHRDVRTHRIRGVMIRHRHVGENCEIREVRKVN